MVTLGAQWLTMYGYLSKHLDHLKARGFSEETLADRRAVIERLCRAVGDLHTATPAKLETWFGQGGWSRATRACYWSHANGYYRWAVRTGRIPANPMDLLDRPRVPHQETRPTSETAFAFILANAVEPYLTAALLARYAGLRCAEICRAVRDDVDEEWIHVHGKGGRVDEIPTHPRIWQHVRGRHGLLVRDAHGRQYRPNTMSSIWATYVREELGIDMHLHRGRHLFGDSLRRAGVDLEVIRTLMRHQSLATTQRYLCVRNEERQTAIQTLPAHANPLTEAA